MPILRGQAVPPGRIRFQPADGVVGVLDTRRVWRFRRQRHVDRDHQQAAGGQRPVHRLLGVPVFVVPGTAVQIEHGGEGPRALWLIDAGHQYPPGPSAPQLNFADRHLELRRGVVGYARVGRGRRRCRVGKAESRGPRDRWQTGCTEYGHFPEKFPSSSRPSGRIPVHADLLALECRPKVGLPSTAINHDSPVRLHYPTLAGTRASAVIGIAL